MGPLLVLVLYCCVKPADNHTISDFKTLDNRLRLAYFHKVLVEAISSTAKTAKHVRTACLPIYILNSTSSGA